MLYNFDLSLGFRDSIVIWRWVGRSIHMKDQASVNEIVLVFVLGSDHGDFRDSLVSQLSLVLQ
jgi:hypothetical protein